MKLPQRQVDDPRAQENFEALQDALFNPGDLKPTMAATAPNGWLLAQGQTLNVADEPALARAMGASGSTFTVPDLRGRAPVGAGTATGAAGATAHALGTSGGEETHVLSVSEMPAHAHPGSAATTGTIAVPTAAPTANVAAAGSGALAIGLTIASQGGGGAHTNMPPFFVVNWLIRT